MKVKFLQDFKGRETGMVFHQKGETVEFPHPFGAALVQLGLAEEVKPYVAPPPSDGSDVFVPKKSAKKKGGDK